MVVLDAVKIARRAYQFHFFIATLHISSDLDSESNCKWYSTEELYIGNSLDDSFIYIISILIRALLALEHLFGSV